ncbi:Exostosin family protein [Rhynchospora pubera]|uniref:Exostosin family protein n=2 Tax=Rhynchospora pubera TaxID=906938 RepID=A0AAV8DLQ3_9POAL|nr:Exostosin family protein [Rhynchospora pubera]
MRNQSPSQPLSHPPTQPTPVSDLLSFTMPDRRPLHHQRMKLFTRRTRHNHFPRFPYLDKLKRYYKWFLWLALSLYFFLSSTTNTPVLFSNPLPLKQTTLPQKTTTRALTESLQFSTSSSSPVKFYIYELPSRFNKDWLSNPRCSTHLFAAEVAIHEALLTYRGRVIDPNEADFFFVPVYVSCNFSTTNGFPSLGHAKPLIKEAINLISSKFPFWNRSRGRDHIFVASHDFGACFHPMEEVAIADGIPEFLKETMLLQTFGVKRKHVCQEAEHAVIPPYVVPEVSKEQPDPAAARRDIFAFFRGKMEVHPKNISGRFYSKKVRTKILKQYGNNPKFYLKRKRLDGYRSEIARSVFCLCPLGWAPWSPRLVESVELGCIPVIIADGIRLPFQSTMKWDEISLTVAEHEVDKLESVLDLVVKTNLTVIQHNLWDPVKRRALLFNNRMLEGDATWHVIQELAGKIDRSWKRQVTGTWR